MKLYTHTTNLSTEYLSPLPYTRIAELGMATQVGHAKTEILSPNTKPINPFSIENLLKSEPPSPPSSLDSSDELTDSSETNPHPPSAPLLLNSSQVAWLLYQSHLQNYWRLLIANSLSQQQAKPGRSSSPVKPVLVPDVYLSQGKTPPHKQQPPPHRGTKRHDVITPSTEKKIKLELVMKESSLHSQTERPLLTREDYEIKCTKALPILHSENLASFEASLSHRTFLELVDINKVLDLSVTDLNAIIDNATFSDEERAYIRELRRKAMNKKAAEECRRRKKSEEQHLTEEFDSLKTTHKRLMSEKERILQDIINLKDTVGELPPENAPTPEATHTEHNALN